MAKLSGKEKYIYMLDYYGKLNDQFDFKDALQGNSLTDLFRADISKFLMYLSASDGVIAQDEVDFILSFLDEEGFTLTRQGLADFIEEHNIYTREFETTAPLILRLTVLMDNELEKNGRKADMTVSEMLVDTFKTVGLEFIRCDGDIDDQEMSDWETYVHTLDSYVKSNELDFINAQTPDGAVAAPSKQ